MRLVKMLYVQVLTGIAAGIVTGYFFPDFTPVAKVMSDTFISMIKMMISPIIFVTIVLGIAGVGDLRKVGRVGGKGLLYFEIVTTIALLMGLLVANFIQPGAGVVATRLDAAAVAQYTDTSKALSWSEFFSHLVPSSVVRAFSDGDILQILFFSVLFGVGVSRLRTGRESILGGFEKISKVLFNVLNIIMKLAPLGAFAGMAYTIGKFGFSALLPLGKLMLSVYLTMGMFIFIALNLIARWFGFSLWKLLIYIKNEILIVLGTSSSESALPLIMEKLETAGIKKSVVGLIVPTGYSFNMDGTAIYLSMAILFLSQALQIPLSIGQQVTVLGVLMITSKGAAGVTGGGFIVLASTLSALHVIPVEGLVLLIGVDRFMSEARSITNLIGNTVATVVIAKSENEVNWDIYREKVEGKSPAETSVSAAV